ncbi:MAG: YcaO-related McrA-glycine thioamidation protein [Thermoproteota archaeon]|jgi:ribosomal protein S12 methylthiotransferase accessory factor|uniref:YcaO-related McrA-glycine thioamidation protein n=1 Tax=Candidatus Methanodesulfokora washburnensis TaxID=2478471 RepID=A0A429GG00_9CREN|nr:YcaO-related McrA-glycine thioamidation protein [Candidatus Methanodesulfokores washburnensis]RSN72800.1 YcaO-related McrA-glycine thioamidation protein [Candidatus Methanodesulfokores washburnensis]RZN62169.1 MAG: YcaO-related McrA-glycine thioamidation protein [Candidatus Methanodesulfokores washburnensis]TDA40596.1 MAG: YcaO-related McrA-glycine thioamidation protein [Candidatus Korarchaeota archaeon]
MLRLERSAKAYREGTHRVRNPEETLSQIESKLKIAGITRISDITGLDRIGIPVYSAVRPSAAQGAVSVYSGKGINKTLAKISAIMEGYERYSAEFKECDKEITIKGTYASLSSKFNILDPDELILPKDTLSSKDLVLRWIKGFDLINDEEIYVPVSSVFHPYTPDGDFHLFKTNTNGLAAGNTIEEAIFHGLMEVIERDAWSIAEVCRRGGRIISAEGSHIVKSLIDKFESSSVHVILRDITSDIGVPVVAAISDDIKLKDPALLTMGFGAHSDPEISAIRALLEVAQSRLVQIQGAREDTVRAEVMRRIGYERMKRINRHWFEADDEVELDKLPKFSSDFIDEDIRRTLGLLKSRGFQRVIVVNLTRPELGIPTVRVIVPGMEIYGIDSNRIGERALSYLRKAR